MKKLTQKKKKLFKVKNIAENTKKSIWWKSNQQGFFSIKPTKPTLWSIAKKIVNNKQTKNFEAQSNFVKQDNKKKKSITRKKVNYILVFFLNENKKQISKMCIKKKYEKVYF